MTMFFSAKCFVVLFIYTAVRTKSAVSLHIGETFPDFDAMTTEGPFNFHSWLGNSWGILMSHPYAFLPVSTTEIAAAGKLYNDMWNMNVKMIALSCDTVEYLKVWIKDIESYARDNLTLPFPIIADEEGNLAEQLGVLKTSLTEMKAPPFSVHAVHIIGPDRKLKLMVWLPHTTGISFDEITRLVLSFKLLTETGVATPVNWRNGGEVVLPEYMTEVDAEKFGDRFVELMPSGRAYMRVTSQPER